MMVLTSFLPPLWSGIQERTMTPGAWRSMSTHSLRPLFSSIRTKYFEQSPLANYPSGSSGVLESQL